MQDRKTAEAGKHALGPIGGKKRGKNLSLGNFLGWLDKQNVGWKKNLSVEKKSVGEFPLPNTDMSGMSGIPWKARPKNGRGGGKNALGSIGRKKN